ncbi:hypothetical protein GYMLUDRAFT_241858 [Collybiopsis luxurians FD-317 M1]|uniref:MYND-type domain-containing protein n=1 Tax=Collybiopsis luxurians FD-317 M1 TaxID=944289 RepID=A0A0D0C5E9_9AGAR|nr:hypothetical protein GYMLUDRAFT_241858 [Collybiopsis luxurians FD-317 M1]
MDPPVDVLSLSLSAEVTAVLLSVASVPPPPSTRHPDSDPAEPLRRQLDQCTECYTSHSVWKPLQKCSGCLIAKYCSRECQKKAWPAHKPTCERNRNNQANWSSERHLAMSALRKFVVKHRPSIAKAALQAFRLQSQPQQALHNFLAIYVTDRRRLFPGSRAHRETAFYVTGAEVREIGQAGSVKDVLQDEVVRINIVARKRG